MLISNFTQWLAAHFAPCNIRCNAIAPGFFVTNQNRSLLFNEDGTPTARTGKILAATTPKGVKKLVEAEPILTFEEIKPVSVTKTPKGAYLYDFGINFTGVCRLKIKGARAVKKSVYRMVKF